MSEITFTIKPEQFLAEIGWKFRRKEKWLSLKVCPFCDGGNSRDQFTFAVHRTDGNYSCVRTKCGASGSFWGLIESQGHNPRDYVEKQQPSRKKRKKKFIYGK